MRLYPRLPQSLAGRFALLLVAALLAANITAVMLLTADRARVQKAIDDARDFGHVVEVIEAISFAPPNEREELARALSNPFLQVHIDASPAVRGTPPRYRALAGRIARAIGSGQAIAVAGRPSWHKGGQRRRDGEQRPGLGGRPQPSTSEPRDDRPPRGDRRALWISATLAQGHYLNIALGPLGSIPHAPFLAPLLLFIGLSLFAVLGVGLLFVRLLTRPMRGLSEAARRAGRGDYSTKVPETGARELRDMAVAFNDMQTRIERFDQDRMRLIAAVGHDLRTPITSLRIRAEMLEDEMREPMVRTLDEMHVMADGLLAFAKGEAGEASETIDLADLAGRLCAEAGTPFRTLAHPKVLGRPVALSRMIMNLLTNAERYASGATATLRETDGWAVLDIEDAGPGIPAERLEEMMQPFSRLDPSRSVETGGAGLGLSIARSVARGHGGELSLSNREEGGLLARVELPLGTGG